MSKFESAAFSWQLVQVKQQQAEERTAKGKIRVRGIIQPQPDLERLAEAFIRLVQQLAMKDTDRAA